MLEKNFVTLTEWIEKCSFWKKTQNHQKNAIKYGLNYQREIPPKKNFLSTTFFAWFSHDSLKLREQEKKNESIFFCCWIDCLVHLVN